MRVLFVKLGAIGDVTQAAAAMLHFRARHPGAEITWVVGKAIAPLLNRFGVADHVHALDESEILSGSLPSRLRALARHALALRGLSSRFDLVVTAYGDWRYRLLTGLVRASRFRHYDRRAIRRPSPLQHRNRVFEYIRLLEDEGERHADISALMQALGVRFLSRRSADLPPMATVPKGVVLAPGGARNLLRSDALRRWPLDHYVKLAEALVEAGVPVTLAGGPADDWVCPAFAHLPVRNLVGQTDLTGMVELLGQAEVVVTHDSGPLHLATITRAGLVALFGPTPANACIPLGRPKTILHEPGNRVCCSPCYDGRDYADCQQALCMEASTVEAVTRSVLALLRSPAAPATEAS